MNKNSILLALSLTLLFLSCDNPSKNHLKSKPPVERSTDQFNAENIGRASWQKPNLVIEKLGDLSNKVVADIGAGTGYFAFRLVFKAEKVIAIDIDPDMIQLMNAFKLNLPQELQSRFDTRLAQTDDPLLAESEADVAIIINTIAYIENRVDYLKTLKRGLKDGGQVMVLDYKMKKLPITAPPRSERVHLSEIEADLENAGYSKVVSDDTSLEYQYILIASK